MTREIDGVPEPPMERAADEVCAERFAAVQAAFERAQRRAAHGACTARYVICDHSVLLRIVGERLARHVQAPLAHLCAPHSVGEAALTIELWDERETQVSAPSRTHHAVGRTWTLADGAFAAAPDGRFVSHALRGSLVWLDRASRHLAGWFADGGQLTLHERGKPMQMLLSLWASDRGLQPVHAALVARGDRGVLIPGSSGSGKTTCALACLDAGYTYLGDDWVGVARSGAGAFTGYGLYSSAYLEAAHAERFPLLATRAEGPRAASDSKSLIQLSDVWPERLGHAASISALALPRIVATAPTPPRRASKREAFLMLLPSTIFTMRPRSGSEAVERLSEIVERVPAYWLDMGPDPARIPEAIDQILADVETS